MKNTKVSAVKALMDANKNISVKEICEQTGLSRSHVYAIRHYIKTTSKTKKKLTRVNKKPKANRVDTNKAIRAENEKLHQFCFEWRNKCDKQDLEIARLQHLYMDSKAVINYLESKIQQLFK
jgi:predicted flavoprotein YhiN